jgi:dimethylamine monooxygenase subunit A
MALRPLDPAEWIAPDEDLEVHLAEKDRLTAERQPEVFAETPGSELAQAELLAKLVTHLPGRFTEIYRREGDTLRIGQNRVVDLKNSDPAALTAGRLVQEDLCIMQSPAPGEPYVLTAASLCFPTRWRLADKIGKPMAAIHAPVPLYADKMARQVDRFFQHLKVEKPVWRINWSLLDDPALFQPTGHGRTAADLRFTPETMGENIWFRSERQTLVRLPESGAIIFGIRIYQTTLAEVASDPIRAHRLLNAIETMAPEMDTYKSFAVFREPLLKFLRNPSVAPL